MRLFTPSLETIVKQKQTQVRGLDAELQKLITGRDTADESIAAIMAEREAAMAAPGDAPPDLGAFDARLRKPQTDRAWFEQRIPAAEAAVNEARAEFREADRMLYREEFLTVADRMQAAYDAFVKINIEIGQYRGVCDLFDPFISPERFDAWKAVKERFCNPPVKLKPADHPTRVVRFLGPLWGKYSGGDEPFLTEDEAFQAVVAGAAVYVFDTEETRALVARAQEERARLLKHPRFAEDFPSQS